MPPVDGSGEAEALAEAVALADAEAEALALADAEALAEALPSSMSSDMAEALAEDIIMSSSIISWLSAKATGANINRATKHSEDSNNNLFIRPPSKGSLPINKFIIRNVNKESQQNPLDIVTKVEQPAKEGAAIVVFIIDTTSGCVSIYVRAINIERNGEKYGSYYQAVRSYREAGKVKQDVIHLGAHVTADEALTAWTEEIRSLQTTRPRKAEKLQRKLERLRPIPSTD